jgi:hypothetical protein
MFRGRVRWIVAGGAAALAVVVSVAALSSSSESPDEGEPGRVDNLLRGGTPVPTGAAPEGIEKAIETFVGFAVDGRFEDLHGALLPQQQAMDLDTAFNCLISGQTLVGRPHRDGLQLYRGEVSFGTAERIDAWYAVFTVDMQVASSEDDAGAAVGPRPFSMFVAHDGDAWYPVFPLRSDDANPWRAAAETCRD